MTTPWQESKGVAQTAPAPTGSKKKTKKKAKKKAKAK